MSVKFFRPNYILTYVLLVLRQRRAAQFALFSKDGHECPLHQIAFSLLDQGFLPSLVSLPAMCKTGPKIQ